MRICRVMNVLPSEASPGGGLGMYRLTQHIPEPCLLVARAAESYPPLPSHVRLVTLRLRDSTLPPGLRAGVFESGARTGAGTRVQARLAARTLRYHAGALVTAIGEIVRFRPDLVVCHSLQRLAYGLVARALLRCKLVLYLHNVSEADALARLPLLRLLARVPDRVAAVSPEIARRLAAWLPAERIWLTSTGVDTEVFRPQGLPRQPQLVTVAHLKWTKGYPYLLEAAARVFARLPDHRLLIVGEGEERARITAEIRRRGLEGRVTLVGVLSRAEVVRVLGESRLFVLASIHEGLPKALLEAVACGTPAVVTDACNAEGIIETTGLSVPPAEPAALADAITALLTDAARWQRCSDSGPAVAAGYDWKTVAARDHALYRGLVTPAAAGVSPSGRRRG